jgi:hypothetical protein
MNGISRMGRSLAKLKAYRDSNRHGFGKVWADSGNGVRKTATIMDWALLRPHASRAFPSNKVSLYDTISCLQMTNEEEPSLADLHILKDETGFQLPLDKYNLVLYSLTLTSSLTWCYISHD